MVDVSSKPVSHRTAVAESIVRLGSEIMDKLSDQGWRGSKGPIFDTAIIAGTMGAKKTAELIPFCHSLNLKSVKINIEPYDEACVRIEATVNVTEQTGVEMEALTAVSIASLTMYDMCKSLSKEISIEETRLIHKSGGKSDYTK